MHRGSYPNPPPAHSPPLHHPVPQHVSTVPQLRSPPPPMPPSQPHSAYGYGQQGGQQPGGAYGISPAFGGFINDPTTQLGFQMGKSAVDAGQQYMEQNFGRFISVGALKHYFNVSNTYVVNKLFIVLFPWRHRPWSRQTRMSNNAQDVQYLPPREDVNSPDMYIPMMALVTYILLSTLLAGLRGAFHPELLGYTATLAIFVMGLEIVVIKLGTFILAINSQSQLLDLVAYSGYKFVGVIISLLLTSLFSHLNVGGSWASWLVFIYCFNANAFFLLRSLRYVLLPDQTGQGVGNSGVDYTVNRRQKSQRTQFLFVYSYLVQLGFMVWLTRV
ncbi:YIF1-domain-containing protein [Byssothecium circinans]|uniref:Protein YIF1 n=1 Tax=Byssothecium circinans TaxID=147558 RepID=A0A6A5UFV5_9PLEO|nr:YIF1-domain-containing protein [Byssothecium circinans]